MQSVEAYIHKLCNCSKRGGRILCSAAAAAEGSCVLMDVPEWTDDMTACTKHRFPGISISVQQSFASLSGFCIVFKCPPPSKKKSQRKMMALFTLALAAVAAAVIYSHRKAKDEL